MQIQEENKIIGSDQQFENQLEDQEIKPQKKFFQRHFLIILTILLVFSLGTGIGLLFYFFKPKYVAVTYINQRDDFRQIDEICINHESVNRFNCTELQINTTRITVTKNDQNATSLILLKGLRLLQFTKNKKGIKKYQDLPHQNTQIEYFLNNRRRFLETPLEKKDFLLQFNCNLMWRFK